MRKALGIILTVGRAGSSSGRVCMERRCLNLTTLLVKESVHVSRGGVVTMFRQGLFRLKDGRWVRECERGTTRGHKST